MQLRIRFLLLLMGVTLSLLCHWVSFTEKESILLMLISFVLFGIPHGALDLYIEGGWSELSDKRKIFFRYLLLAGLYGLLWYIMPSASLLIFLLITAFHFGEIDWIGKKSGSIPKIIYFFSGLCWIFFLLSYHVQEALRIFNSITRNQIKVDHFILWGKWILQFSVFGMVGLFAILFFLRKRYFENAGTFYMAAFQQLLLVLLALFTPLWIFFAFYFGLWHSVLSLDKIRLHFNLASSVKGWLFLLRKALPFSIMAWFGILYFTFLTVSSNDSSGMLSLLFIGLAILTVPHLFIFTKLGKE